MSGRQISWATLTLVGVAGFIAGFGVIAAWSGQVPGTVRQAPIRTVIVGAGVDAGEGDNPVPEPIPTAAGVARAEAPLEAIPTGLPVSPATPSPAPAAERAAAPAPPTAPKPAAASGPAVATAPAPGPGPEPTAPKPAAASGPAVATAPAPGPEPKAPAASVATGAKSDAPSSLGESDAPSSPPSSGGSSPASSASSVPSPAGGALAPSLEKSWWLQAKGRPCHLIFGTHPGLNVRSGSLTDGKVVRWRDYSRNKAIARLVKHRNPVVTPVAFGFTKKGGPPLAVQIQFDHDGRRLEGVLALRINGRYLKLVPVQ